MARDRIALSPRGVTVWLSCAGAFLAGAALRLYRLGPQVLVGDEIHAIRAVATRPLPGILWTFGVTDVCMPLAGLARWLSERGVVLSEGAFRTPVVVLGLLLLALFPWTLRRVSAPTAALVLPWWLALSPQLVLYGRLARSYTPSTLLAGLAVAAFFAWWRTRRPLLAAAYAVLGALSVWFHLLAAVFVAAPLGFAGVAKLVRFFGRKRSQGGERPARPGWLPLVLVGLALAVGLACFLVPGWASLSEVLANKRGTGEIRADTLRGAAVLLAGTPRPVLVVLFWGAAAWGFAALFRRDRELALYSAFPLAVHLAALWVLRPYGVASPLIFARYQVVALPVVLLWVAHAFAWDAGRSRWASRAGVAIAAALLAAILATGPFATPRFHDSSFVHHEDFLAFHRPLPTLLESWMPNVYQRLGRHPGGGAIVELPAYPEGQNRAFHRYQDVHRREVILATPDPVINDPRFEFRNRVRPDPASILATRARYLVVHRDLESEERAVELPPGVSHVWGARQRNLSKRFRDVAEAFPRHAARVLGPPDAAYARVVVWDLDRVRRERARTRSGGSARALSSLHGAQAPSLVEDLPAPASRPGDLRLGGGPRPRSLRLADLPVAVAAGDRAGVAGDPPGGGEHRRADRGPGGGPG